VAPAGAWEQIRRSGLRTAEQLILAADLDDALRLSLLGSPRAAAVALTVTGQTIVLRDQAPLLKRKDLQSLMADGMDVADWIRLLNRRIYLFSREAAMRTLLEKYVARDGAQDILVISPLRLLDAVGSRIELTTQNTGAIARRAGAQKSPEVFQPLRRFPNRVPTEVTVVDGVGDLGVVVRAERVHRDGRREELRA